MRSTEVRCKQYDLDESNKELASCRAKNQRLSDENASLARDNDRVACECHDLGKQLRYLDVQNHDFFGKVSSSEARLKTLEDDLFSTRRDVDGLRSINYLNKNEQGSLLDEKCALVKHCELLTNQNGALTDELNRFVETDDQLRQQLDRRGYVRTVE